MSRPVHCVVLLLSCCLWSGVVGSKPTESTSAASTTTSEPTTTSTGQCRSECCQCIEQGSCFSTKCPKSCSDFECDTNDCECCGGCGFAMEFMVAAQIALGAALLLAVSALSFLIWKMCFRNSIAMVQGRNRVRAFCGLPELPRRSSASSSLNSVQNFVIQKMRDRPPRYDESPPQMPPCYDEIMPSSSGHPVTECGTATLPLYEQIYPGTSRGEPSNAAAAAVEISISNSTVDRHHPDSGTAYSIQSNENSTRAENNILYDEACGGMVNPAFIPEIQEQHI